jgi:hypothetical protein
VLALLVQNFPFCKSCNFGGLRKHLKMSAENLLRLTLPLWRNGEVRHCEVYLVLPHEMFACLAAVRPESLRQSEDEVLRFWESVKDEPWCRAHPALKSKCNLQDLIPYTIHGDDAVVHQGDKSAAIMSWTALLTRGSVWTNRYLYACVPSKWLTKSAVDLLVDVLAWSLQCMLDGEWPRAQTIALL